MPEGCRAIHFRGVNGVLNKLVSARIEAYPDSTSSELQRVSCFLSIGFAAKSGWFAEFGWRGAERAQ